MTASLVDLVRNRDLQALWRDVDAVVRADHAASGTDDLQLDVPWCRALCSVSSSPSRDYPKDNAYPQMHVNVNSAVLANAQPLLAPARASKLSRCNWVDRLLHALCLDFLLLVVRVADVRDTEGVVAFFGGPDDDLVSRGLEGHRMGSWCTPALLSLIGNLERWCSVQQQASADASIAGAIQHHEYAYRMQK